MLTLLTPAQEGDKEALAAGKKEEKKEEEQQQEEVEGEGGKTQHISLDKACGALLPSVSFVVVVPGIVSWFLFCLF